MKFVLEKSKEIKFNYKKKIIDKEKCDWKKIWKPEDEEKDHINYMKDGVEKYWIPQWTEKDL